MEKKYLIGGLLFYIAAIFLILTIAFPALLVHRTINLADFNYWIWWLGLEIGTGDFFFNQYTGIVTIIMFGVAAILLIYLGRLISKEKSEDKYLFIISLIVIAISLFTAIIFMINSFNSFYAPTYEITFVFGLYTLFISVGFIAVGLIFNKFYLTDR